MHGIIEKQLKHIFRVSCAYAGAMRRLLVALVVSVAAGAVITVYWSQHPELHRAQSSGLETASSFQQAQRAGHVKLSSHINRHRASAVNTTPIWTWSCVNNHCERRQIASGESVSGATSHATCGMTCGSTQLWPQPTGPVTLSSHVVAWIYAHEIAAGGLDNRLELRVVRDNTQKKKVHKKVEEYLNKAFDIFKENINSLVELSNDERSDVEPDIEKFVVRISVLGEDTQLSLTTDERYNLTLRPIKKNMVATINAPTCFGARHALETLSQLIWWDDISHSLRMLRGATIEDAPKFAYRGIMLDTARNFFTLDAIKRAVDGMASSKLNTLHWHISDSQSFPLDAPSVPQMARTGAYSPEQIYTGAEVEELSEYAAVRGVRVVIEIDTPAHAGAGWTWGPARGLGALAVCVGAQPWPLYCGEPPCGQLNPANPNVYKVLEMLYADIIKLTNQNEIFHLGGDEVNLECWAQQRGYQSTDQGSFSPQNYNYTDMHELWGDFTVQALKSLERANKNKVPSTVIIWSSNLTKNPYLSRYLNRTTFVIQTWGGSQWMETTDLLDAGYKIIISHVDAWYLDCGFGKWREMGDAACDPYRTWQTVYSHRPWHRMNLPPHKMSLVLGGEACLWSEQVSEGALDSRLWPRGAALGERLWSDPRGSDIGPPGSIPEDTYTRLATLRDRLVKRGIQAEAMWPYWCTNNPGKCL